VRLEELLRSVEQEPEGKENLDIRTLLEQSIVNVLGIFQLVYTN
jgi:hypothetical protein